MDQKEKELIHRTFEYARENNKILRRMRSSMRINSFLRVVYWIIVIVAAVWFYYYLEPMLTAFGEFYKNLGGLENIQNLIKSEPSS